MLKAINVVNYNMYIMAYFYFVPTKQLVTTSFIVQVEYPEFVEIMTISLAKL